ncbi:MAG: F0F1 ATP synthase subunit delta [Candidatus Daviesbacteria bacterium]|nr:F0F1 ATP synthase subunit delta [Candidatus Daviesbacteria bacterium]
MDDILAAILKDTYSLTQYKHRVMILKAHLVQSFFGGGPTLHLPGEGQVTASTHLEGVASEVNLGGQDTAWLNSLPESFYKQFTKDNVYDIFSNLEKQSNTLQVLTLYLTFEPDDATLNQIGTRARTAFGFPALVLDIKLNPNLIAGTTLSWKGRMRDYSLKAKLEEKRQELSEEFRKFLR